MALSSTFFEDIGLLVPSVLTPKSGTDLNKWATIACDQYTTDFKYWATVKELVADSPSTLKLMFPEVYLNAPNKQEMLSAITASMRSYLASGVLVQQNPGFILVERRLNNGKIRKGLVVALDLERYDYRPNAKTLIRTTEGTFIEKVHTRVEIREKAQIELPHILVLIDDPKRTVIEPLFNKNPKKLYDFDLMMGGGHLNGYLVDEENSINEVVSALRGLVEPEAFKSRYSLADEPPFLYAMGDGNHSFAAAQLYWKKIKEEAKDKVAIMNHPARFALVELLNIHDEGLDVEPIHRAMLHVDPEDFMNSMVSFFKARGSEVSTTTYDNFDSMWNETPALRKEGVHVLPFIKAGKFGALLISNPKHILEMETLELYLDEYERKNPSSKLEFIHGEDVVTELGSRSDNVGFYLPGFIKGEVFKTVIINGPYPRKTISMGNAEDKRYYMDCRQIVPEPK